MIYLSENVIFGINGPVVTIKGETDLSMMEMVYVGKEKLIGEVIGLDKKMTTIQVYEETTGLKPGEPVYSTGLPMSVTLGPGIIGNIFDGIERPLPAIEKKFGAFIGKGAQFSPLDTEKKYKVTLKVKVGDTLSGGDIYAECPETPVITHKIMLSPLLSGTVTEVMPDGEYTVNDTVAKIKDKKGNETELTLLQKWPIRNPRPIKKRLPATKPLVTGQRVIDTVFPVAKGGAAAIPGGFGTGKTMTQHQLAKWCDADIIIYVGCGERGNEMTQVLTEFSDITDPKTGRPLLDRTMLIANTSNMPVAAREASIYTGITIAEYYRDMGYDTALMADSTSRWAEALREISGRLEENSLMEIVKLIGADVLPDDQKLVIEIARVIRVGFLQQNAFHADDTFVPLEKQFKMMHVILHLYHRAKEVVARQIPLSKITATGLFDKFTKMKYDVPNSNIEMLDDYIKETDAVMDGILK